MMEWVVVKYKNGEMKVQSREYREGLIKELRKGEQIEGTVIKTFENENEADKYLGKIKEVNRLIKEM